MLRLSLWSVVCLVLLTGGLLAADQPKDTKDNKDNTTTEHKDHTNKNAQKAKIVKVDPKNGTVTVEMKDKEGKECERTFHLTQDVEVLDENTGKVAALDVFRSGDEVLFVEAEGKLRELHKNKTGQSSEEHKNNTDEHKTNKDEHKANDKANDKTKENNKENNK